MQQDEGFAQFIGEADRFYHFITGVEEVVGLWEQLDYISEKNDVDFETIFEIDADGRTFKVIYGPPFTIVFQNGSDGLLVVYSIRRPGF